MSKHSYEQKEAHTGFQTRWCKNSKGREDFMYTIHKKKRHTAGECLKRRKMYSHSHSPTK